jgi:hypothetical protein
VIHEAEVDSDEESEMPFHSFAAPASDLPALKRRKLSEATNRLAHVNVDQILPAYQTALSAVQPAPEPRKPLSRQELANFLTKDIEDSEEDGSFKMDADQSSDEDDSMSDASELKVPRTAAQTARQPSEPLQTTMDANGLPPPIP